MRYKLKDKPSAKNYKKEVLIKKYLFLPKLINREWRWLEYTGYVKVVDFSLKSDGCGYFYEKYKWVDKCWIEDWEG
jgi:hypothetical protein